MILSSLKLALIQSGVLGEKGGPFWKSVQEGALFPLLSPAQLCPSVRSLLSATGPWLSLWGPEDVSRAWWAQGQPSASC